MWLKNLVAGSFLWLLLVGQPGLAQSTYDSDIVLFVDEDSLTIYVAYPEPVSFEGFQFKVVQEGEPVEFSPHIRFDILILNDYVLPHGTCLIYRYDPTAQPPTNCDPDNTFYARVGPGDRFWFDSDGSRRTISITRNGVTTYQVCSDFNSVCPIYYNIPKPVINDASEIPPFNPPETNFEPIYAETNLFSNRGSINQVAWSPDGTQLVTGHANGDLCLWDPNKSAATSPVTCFDGAHIDGVTAVVWNPNPDSLELASAGGDGVVRLWTVNTSPEAQLERFSVDFTHTAPVNDLSWHPTESKLATVSDGRLNIWNLPRADIERQFIISNPQTVDWRSDGRYLLTLSDGKVLRVVDSTSQEDFTILKIYPSALLGKDAAWQPDFGDLASLTSDGTLELYDYSPGTTCPESNCPSTFLAQNLVNASEVQFSPNGTLIAIALSGEVHVMEAREPYHLITKYAVPERSDTVFTSIAWSPDGERLVGADSQGGIHIWTLNGHQNIQRIQEIAHWRASRKGVLALTWHPIGGGLAVVDEELLLSVWTRDGNQVGSSVAHTELPLAIDWNDSQQVIGTGGCGPTGTIWGLNVAALITMDIDFGTTNCVTALGFNPSGAVLAMADESGVLRIWDWSATPPTAIRTKLLALAVNDIGWDTSGLRLASVDDAGSITVFDMINYQTTPIFTRQPNPGIPVNALAWTPYDDRSSPNGERLATASSAGWIAIWRMQRANFQPNSPFDGSYLLEGHNSPVLSLSWSPNHDWLVSVSEDKQIIVWDALTGQRLAQEVLDGPPSDISWSPVGASFAVTDLNGYITLFDFNY